MHFQWENLLDVEELGLLIEICTLDDVVQASYDMYDLYSGKKGEKGELTLRLDVTPFMDATYRMRYTFFNKNSFGEGRCVEALAGLCFTKEITNRGDKLTWHPKQWGYFHMPTPRVVEVK